ncbi:MAG: hypothetical protein COU29_01340 [Candidatus Magasanikbacteria bacterium CG10_big_fil_rev_8_21_14_0_10_36_32]|uniref:Uncharacterized protein n=1 Tax=Candidatus Magasanikbacteria bacterium CG10_big_fil_rev_8_21_14_0_10_36_32 TaxID=1974646 RepID=A0A2M6W6K8_9BACT|nr:MAG: hypothetical protein COU29_01340 [Candidatus Magasanikbacteria bacterium CG10_big_fil_rev_8_21_14_0_10_36_32]
MKVVEKPSVDGLPEGRKVVYFGMINSAIYFVIYCSNEKNPDLFSYRINMGLSDDLVSMPIESIVKRGTTLTIQIEQGEFIFDTRKNCYLKATFGGQPIDIF